MYNRFGHHQWALDSLLVAQQLDPNDHTLVSALERSYRVLGQTERADRLARQVRRHRESNPFYYYAVAQQALERGGSEQGLEAIERAIKLRPKEPRFHYLQSLLHRQLGNTRLAEVSLRRAQRQGWQAQGWQG